MDHVEDTLACPGNDRFIAKELAEPIASARSINARDPENDRWEILQGLLRLQENPSSFAGRFGRAGFLDPGAIGLSINAGAAGVDKFLRRSSRKPGSQIAHPLQINLSIFPSASFARRNGIQDPVKRAGKLLQIRQPRDVTDEWTNSSILQ